MPGGPWYLFLDFEPPRRNAAAMAFKRPRPTGLNRPEVRTCGRNSVAECQLPKLNVVGSNPIARFSTPVDSSCQRASIVRTVKALERPLAPAIPRRLARSCQQLTPPDYSRCKRRCKAMCRRAGQSAANVPSSSSPRMSAKSMAMSGSSCAAVGTMTVQPKLGRLNQLSDCRTSTSTEPG